MVGFLRQSAYEVNQKGTLHFENLSVARRRRRCHAIVYIFLLFCCEVLLLPFTKVLSQHYQLQKNDLHQSNEQKDFRICKFCLEMV